MPGQPVRPKGLATSLLLAAFFFFSRSVRWWPVVRPWRRGATAQLALALQDREQSRPVPTLTARQTVKKSLAPHPLCVRGCSGLRQVVCLCYPMPQPSAKDRNNIISYHLHCSTGNNAMQHVHAHHSTFYFYSFATRLVLLRPCLLPPRNQNFLRFLSHQIFKRMHRVLNIEK